MLLIQTFFGHRLVTMVLGMLNDIVRFFAVFIPVFISFVDAYLVLFREVEGLNIKYHNLMMMLLRYTTLVSKLVINIFN